MGLWCSICTLCSFVQGTVSKVPEIHMNDAVMGVKVEIDFWVKRFCLATRRGFSRNQPVGNQAAPFILLCLVAPQTICDFCWWTAVASKESRYSELILEYVGRLDDLFLPSTLLHGKLTPGLHCTVQDAVKLWTLERIKSNPPGRCMISDESILSMRTFTCKYKLAQGYQIL